MAFFTSKDLGQIIVDGWMDMATTSKGGAILQWGIMTTVNAAASIFGLFNINSATNATGSAEASEVFNQLQQILILPNFMGIPLYSATEIVDRQVNVSEQPTIVQSGMMQQAYADNAVPRLRTWQYDAYLKTYPGLEFFDHRLLVKPTLVMQEDILDKMAKSRYPGWLKTSNGAFELAMITSLHIEHTANISNAVHINIAFKEYKAIAIRNSDATVQRLLPGA